MTSRRLFLPRRLCGSALIGLGLALLVFFVLATPQIAHAGPFDWAINLTASAIIMAFQFLFNIIMWFLGILLSLAGMFVDFILSARTLAGSTAVQEGWRFVRDSLNFIFILALLAISFATIVGIESYGMRALLPRLIAAALLVNFSLAIAGAFLQTANVLTRASLEALNAGGGGRCVLAQGARGGGGGTSLTCHLVNTATIANQYLHGPSSILRAVGLPAISTFEPRGGFQLNISVFDANIRSYLGTAVSSAISVFFVAMFTVAMLVLCAMLGVRIAVLLILLVLSPVPYFFSVIPKVGQYAEKWWSTFVQYTFFLPAIVFFLVLAINMVRQGQNFAETQLGMNPAFIRAIDIRGANGESVGISFFSVFFISAFILVAILVARAMGIAGANMAIGFARQAVTGTALGSALVTGRVAREAGKGAAYGAIKYGESTLPGAGIVAGAGRGLAAVTRAPRAILGAARRTVTGETANEQLDRQKKALATYSESAIKAQARLGNLGAIQLAMDRDYDLGEADYQQALRYAPIGSELRENVRKGYEKKFPVTAVLGAQRRADLAAGKKPTVTSDEQDRLQKAIRRIKPEDYVKLKKEDLQAAMEAGIPVPITKAQLSAVFDSTNTDLQDAATDYVLRIRGRGTAAAAGVPGAAAPRPGEKAIEKFARERLGI